LIIVPIYKVDEILVIIQAYNFICKLLGIINVDFNARGQLLITYSAFIIHLKKNVNTMKQWISSSL